MEFELLGPLRVLDDGKDVDLGGPRQQRVLAALLSAGTEQLSTDALIEAVWGEDAPATATHVVRTYLSNLRSAIDGRIRSDGNHYGIDTTHDRVDADEFLSLVTQAERTRHSDPVRTCALLSEADALWRGYPFGHLGEGSLIVERRATELAAMRVHAKELAFEARLELGEHDAVIPQLESLIAEHPYDERLHQLLMLALYRAGRQADALRTGLALRERLRDELGLDPAPATSLLEDRILRQDPDLDLVPPSNLPSSVTTFIGRELEIAEVVKLLDTRRLVTVTGPGGIGKTRLALEVARVTLDRFHDGVWWIDLSSLPQGADVARRVCEVLGLTDQPGVDPMGLVRRFVAHRSFLFVLDNCEHVVEAASSFVEGLLAGGPNVKVLATSRMALHVKGQSRYECPAMSLPTASRGLSDAERLFVERANEADSAFSIDDAVGEDIAVLCRAIDGVPLAIELAASRTRLMAPSQINRRLGRQLDLLAGPSEHPARHVSMATAITWSYDLLTRSQQLLFDRLSVFAGPFDVDAAAAVAGWDMVHGGLDDFHALVDASMVARDHVRGGSVRFRMLDVMREFGRERLHDRGEDERVARRHATYHMELAADATRLAYTPELGPAIERLGAVNEDLDLALAWALEREPELICDDVATGLVHYWYRRGDPASAFAFGSRMRDVQGASPAFVAGANMAVAFGSQLLGDYAGAVEAMGIAIPILEAGDDWRLQIFALNGQGQGGVMAGMPGMSEEMGTRILEICEKRGLLLPRAYGLALLGEAQFFGDGDLDLAESHLTRAIELFGDIGDDVARNMFGLGVLAGVLAVKGDLDAAERAAVEASLHGGPGWSATALIVLGGFVLTSKGELDRAEDVIITGLQRVYERSMEAWVRPALLMLGRIAARRHHWEEAAWLLGAARANLTPWALHPRFWDDEPLVRAAVGDERYDEITKSAAAESVDDVVARVLRTHT